MLTADVVGPVCETSDFFLRDARIAGAGRGRPARDPRRRRLRIRDVVELQLPAARGRGPRRERRAAIDPPARNFRGLQHGSNTYVESGPPRFAFNVSQLPPVSKESSHAFRVPCCSRVARSSLLLAPLRRLAQTTGSVSGVVRDSNGAPLPGVLVSITGPQMPLGRTVTTRTDGVVPVLQPHPGHLPAEGGAAGPGHVRAGRRRQRSPRTPRCARCCARRRPSRVDGHRGDCRSWTRRPPDISQRHPTRTTIEKLPLARTFSGTFQLAPGVVDSGVAISNTNVGVNAGGGRQDNTYLYDGVNVTNPFFGDLYQDFAELDIQEVNITRAGVLPEYGRTGGFIVNGVTKSGTNNSTARCGSSTSPPPSRPTATTRTCRPRPSGSGRAWASAARSGRTTSSPTAPSTTTGRTRRTASTRPATLPDSDLDDQRVLPQADREPDVEHADRRVVPLPRHQPDQRRHRPRHAPSTGDKPKEIDRVGVLSAVLDGHPVLQPRGEVQPQRLPERRGAGRRDPVPGALRRRSNPADSSATGARRAAISCFGVNPLAINDDNFRRNEYRLTGPGSRTSAAPPTRSRPASTTATTGKTSSRSPTAGARSSSDDELQLRPGRRRRQPPAVLPRALQPGPAAADLARPHDRHLPAGPGDLEPPDRQPRRARQPGQLHPQRQRSVHVRPGRLPRAERRSFFRAPTPTTTRPRARTRATYVFPISKQMAAARRHRLRGGRRRSTTRST